MRFGHLLGVSVHTEVNEEQKTLAGLGYSKNPLLMWFRLMHRPRHSVLDYLVDSVKEVAAL